MMRYRIRKQVISTICILACGVNLAACAKTPEKKIVVDKYIDVYERLIGEGTY